MHVCEKGGKQGKALLLLLTGLETERRNKKKQHLA